MLREQGIEPDIIKYLETPPDEATLDQLLIRLEMEPRDLMRKKESDYRELGLANDDFGRAELIAAMTAHPRLIERPIVVSEKGVVLGRPTEKILEIL